MNKIMFSIGREESKGNGCGGEFFWIVGTDYSSEEIHEDYGSRPRKVERVFM